MDNSKVYKTGIQNILYSVFAQGLSFFLSIVSGFIMPKAMGITQYGYWQVYLFYLDYIMLFGFGFNDGLYLRYGKLDYSQLPFKKLRFPMRIFIFLMFTIGFIFFMVSFLEKDPNKIFAYCAISASMLTVGINGTLLTVLQFTNRIKLYSFFSIANKISFVLVIIFLLFIKVIDFRFIIAVDFSIKVILVGINMYKSKELFIGETQGILIGFKEYFENVRVGVKLTFANILGSLLIGIGRFIVERYMPLKIYSLYSFATTITTTSLIFISAASLSLYPLLKRMKEDSLPSLYINLNKIISLGLFIILIGYYPLYYFIKLFFSSFIGIFDYFYLLFIIIVSQGKMQFLINTYYKALREERAMFLANLSGVLVSLVIIIPSFYFTHSIVAVVLGTTLSLLWRCYASEIYLKKKMQIIEFWNIGTELIMIVLFVLSVILFKPIFGCTIYTLAVCLYTIKNIKLLKNYSNKIYRLVVNG